MKRLLCVLTAILMLTTALLSCDGESTDPNAPTSKDEMSDGDSEVLSKSNLFLNIGKYTVVRPENAGEAVKKAATLVRNVAKSTAGGVPGLTTDWLDPGSSLDPAAPEILIGDTNRDETAQAKEMMSSEADHIITQIGNKICIVGKNEAATAKAVTSFLCVYFGYTEQGAVVYHSVKDYGAGGDGETDDTVAFEKAIKAAEKDGLPVYVPAGTYLVTETLKLNCVTMYGYESGSWTADTIDLPPIYHNNLEEPLFDVFSGSLSGLNIHVQGTSAEMSEAAETIKVSGVGSHLSSLRIHTPWIGIQATYGNTGRSVFENILIVQAWKTGLDISGTWDVATLQNIEVWNSGKTCPTAFRFGKNDALHAVNLFCFNAGTGFEFYNTPDGGCWGSFDNCGVDLTSIGVSVGEGTHHLTFVGGTFWGHHHGLKVTAETAKDTLVTFNGGEILTNGASPIDVHGGRMTTVTGCNIVRIAKDHSAIPVNIGGGAGVTIVGNTITTRDCAVALSSGFKGAANITGNTILTGATDTKSVVKNQAKSATVNTDGNVINLNQSFD